MEIELTQEDEARLRDSSHSIQAATESLEQIDAQKISELPGIRKCLRDADQTLRNALRSVRARFKR